MAMLDADITVRRGDFVLTAQFSADDGVTAVIGPSGAGKSTLAEAICGLGRRSRGHIILDGRILMDSSSGIDVKAEHRRIGLVFQAPTLFPHLSVRRNLAFGIRRNDPVLWEQVTDVLDLYPFLSRRPATLSGGEARRVAIGRALLSRPALLILDEPTAGLDPARRDRLLGFLENVRDFSPCPTLLITHRLEEAQRLAGHAILLADGRVSDHGALDDVLSGTSIAETLGADELGAVLSGTVIEKLNGLSVIDTAAGQLRTTTALPERSRARLRILARDVALALERPKNTSVLNTLPAVIEHLHPQGVHVDVTLRLAPGADEQPVLYARITRLSAERLGLAPGSRVFALIKAVATSRASSRR